MKLTIDPEADALYLRLNDAQILDSEQVATGVVLDYDALDNGVGVEMLHLSRRGNPVDMDKLVFETLWANRSEEMVVRETPSSIGEENS